MIKLISDENNSKIYELSNAACSVLLATFGATVLEIRTPDKEGHFDNIVLGYPTLEEYRAMPGTYFGATVGRVANRIAKGQFSLNGKSYQLAINNGPNTNHGGLRGFSYQEFEDEVVNDHTLKLRYHSADGEENFPGNLDLCVTVHLRDNQLIFDYEALCDQDTLVNITNHSYFNLNPDHADISNHYLSIPSVRHGIVDSDGLATGSFRNVEGTPMDFQSETRLGDVLCHEQDDEQLQKGHGIDHHFDLEPTRMPLRLYEKESGRLVEVTTSYPGIQIYTGNYIPDGIGRDQRKLGFRCGVAIEPQFLPDGIHSQQQPDMLLRKDTLFRESIHYAFSIRHS